MAHPGLNGPWDKWRPVRVKNPNRLCSYAQWAPPPSLFGSGASPPAARLTGAARRRACGRPACAVAASPGGRAACAVRGPQRLRLAYPSECGRGPPAAAPMARSLPPAARARRPSTLTGLAPVGTRAAAPVARGQAPRGTARRGRGYPASARGQAPAARARRPVQRVGAPPEAARVRPSGTRRRGPRRVRARPSRRRGCGLRRARAWPRRHAGAAARPQQRGRGPGSPGEGAATVPVVGAAPATAAGAAPQSGNPRARRRGGPSHDAGSGCARAGPSRPDGRAAMTAAWAATSTCGRGGPTTAAQGRSPARTSVVSASRQTTGVRPSAKARRACVAQRSTAPYGCRCKTSSLTRKTRSAFAPLCP